LCQKKTHVELPALLLGILQLQLVNLKIAEIGFSAICVRKNSCELPALLLGILQLQLVNLKIAEYSLQFVSDEHSCLASCLVLGILALRVSS
jgi:hypothetical protein